MSPWTFGAKCVVVSELQKWFAQLHDRSQRVSRITLRRDIYLQLSDELGGWRLGDPERHIRFMTPWGRTIDVECRR